MARSQESSSDKSILSGLVGHFPASGKADFDEFCSRLLEVSFGRGSLVGVALLLLLLLQGTSSWWFSVDEGLRRSRGKA